MEPEEEEGRETVNLEVMEEGGGGNAIKGEDGSTNTNDTNDKGNHPSGQGGERWGSFEFLSFGGGGGSGHPYYSSPHGFMSHNLPPCSVGAGGKGGNGGGSVWITAVSLVNEGVIEANGCDGGNGSVTGSGGGGGGGGSIVMNCETLSLGVVTAAGGKGGGKGDYSNSMILSLNSDGGRGGDGRIGIHAVKGMTNVCCHSVAPPPVMLGEPLEYEGKT